MPLFWIVNQVGAKRRVFIGEGSSLIYARLQASMAGFEGAFLEAHQLDAGTVKKIPKAMIGRVLSQNEASTLLKKLG